MSGLRAPTEARIKRAALTNAAVRAALSNPPKGYEELSTEAAILEGLPIVLECERGYVSCNLADYENGLEPHGMGALVAVRPLAEGDEFHPAKMLYVFFATMPQTALGRKPARGKPRAIKPKAAPVELSADEAEALASDLGIL